MNEQFTETLFKLLARIGARLRVQKNGFKLVIREDGSGVIYKIEAGVKDYKMLYDFDTLTELITRFLGD
jgi:hypothetical protein